ncbi:alpha/beta fold hydrolase [Paenibacillus sp. L3-i20]|uniref:alpha/beta fold hydrolase n=1 Tax=Paenibacillus sp. L3-i20 TaxID=2905833 RepID=UPI001EDD24EC|nr:alpha/beta hydrolase [Paenibacillus sp. L3-i20]GKU80079.1 alpha/beta hydrolase [Paenibacillus sp. L3-i20]
MYTIISKDGTEIAYEKQGNGPAVVLVASALADHMGASQLAEHLAKNFTVYNYDRRGRGNSSNTLPYDVGREVEDIEAIINEAGGEVSLFGSSSGAVLALEAASKLGNKVTKLFMYEPPFIINDSRPPVPADYVQHLNNLIEAGKRSEAVEYFMIAAAGVPAEFVEYMKMDPSWQAMEGLAHTLAYDGLVMGTTQQGNSLPANKWNVEAKAMVMTGENSSPFFHDAAKALSELLSNVEHSTLSGQDHAAIMMAPAELAEAITEFLNK